MAVHIPGLLAVIVFYVIILITGIWASRKSKREEEKCTGEQSEVSVVGGRNLSAWVGVFTMTATWIGGGFILGTAEMVYNPSAGLVTSLAPVGFSLSLIIGGLFFVKPMRVKNYVTMMDPFQIKYGDTLTSVFFILAFIADIMWVACVLAALGGTMTVILDLASYQSIIISAAVAIFYTLLGGLYSVAYTDVIQLIFIAVSLWFCIPFLMTNSAVTDITYTATHEVYQLPWIGSVDEKTVWPLIDNLLLISLGGLCYQSFFQRVLAVSTTRQAQVTCYVAAICCFSLGIPPVLIGAVAASTDWNQTSYGLPTPYEKGEASYILPIVLQHLCSEYIAIAGIGAIAAAVMSSMDSALLSCSSMFARNIYKQILRKKASDREVQWVIKFGILLFGLTGMGLAMLTNSVYSLFLMSGELIYAVFFPQLVCIMYLPKTNAYGAMAGLVVGTALRLLSGEPFLHIPPVIHYPGCTLIDGVYVQFFPLKTLSMIASFFTIVSISYLILFLFKRGFLPEKWDIYNLQEKAAVTLKTINLKEHNETISLDKMNCENGAESNK
ncbi:high affinity choline transporter 1-like [Polypterus senegalus]|uniref:high affinity choline transporter 1-like n=1 Tax=Polypterus senegalus TaxID=55291 RepID=UPI001965426C|nr:high affinity choline transporter 1-like [Polypterus senegalus]XP_039600066.1 high affinity choline transporter 1-like [Polypterus senegalus]